MMASAGPPSHFFTSVEEAEPRHKQQYTLIPPLRALVSTGTVVVASSNRQQSTEPEVGDHSILIGRIVDIKIDLADVPEDQ